MAAQPVPFDEPPLPSNALRPQHRREGLHAMVIDRDRDVLECLRTMLIEEKFRVSGFVNGADAVAELRRGLRPDVVLIDTQLPGQKGLATLAEIRELRPALPVAVISCSYEPRYLIQTMQLGAADILLKPFDREEVKALLLRCVASVSDDSEGQHQIALADGASFVFASERMKSIANQCAIIARVDLPVLIMGESGTGKEVLAQYIHKMSPFGHRTFLKVNCAAMPADLLESELFGYEQGAFTGAVKSKPGKFEMCNNGTILLDEIGEMPPALQAKLLQVLQDGSFSRLGGRTTIKVNVRVIAATNIDMKAAIAERKFREDLYYRLNGFSLCLPPLRERKEEIPALIRYFVQVLGDKYARRPPSISDEFLRACVEYSWPGNLRELENFIKRYLVLGDEKLMISSLAAERPPSMSTASPAEAGSPGGGLKKMVSSLKGEAEARVISASLERNNWNRKQSAAELKISYKALLYKIRQYEILHTQHPMMYRGS